MRILLHACCGPCASVAVERLLAGDHEVALFFSNANLLSRQEWSRRLEAVQNVGARFNILVEVEPCDGAAWMPDMEGERLPSREPEGGARCARCFEWRLARTCERARVLGLRRLRHR